MGILYEDRYLVCDEDAITIKDYYFPFGSKRLSYDKIKKVREMEIGPLSGRYRIWGMDLAPYWYHLDILRPKKQRSIVLETGEMIKPAITPEQHDTVLAVLKEKTRKGAEDEI